MADDDNSGDGDCSGCIILLIIIAVVGGILAAIVSTILLVTVLILIFGAWLPYACYGKPASWKDYICQWCLLTWCWCSANRPPKCFRNYCCCCVCYQIDEGDGKTEIWVVQSTQYWLYYKYRSNSNIHYDCLANAIL